MIDNKGGRGMTGHEALKLIYDLVKENSDKLDAKTIFHLGEAVGTLNRIIEEKCERIEQSKTKHLKC